jgi:hypothetical protein
VSLSRDPALAAAGVGAVARLDGEPFVVMGGSGFDALLFERTSEG